MVQHPSPTAEMDADPDGNRPKGSTDGRPAPRQACIECRRRVSILLNVCMLTGNLENKVMLIGFVSIEC
jgi:hypothetical protein